MFRCGVPKDNVVRLGVLCLKCAVRAAEILEERGEHLFQRPYNGERPCEGCGKSEDSGAACEQ